MKSFLVNIFLRLIEIRNRQQYLPNRWGVFSNPFYILRRRLYQNILLNAKFISGNVLDYGCGTSPYQTLFNYNQYHRSDIVNENSDSEITIISAAQTIYENDSFDSVICSEVLEHVEDVGAALDEIYRVLKPGGYALITTPFVWPLHAHPYDFRRFTLDGLTSLLKDKQFVVKNKIKSSSYLETIFQLIVSSLFIKIKTKNILVNLFITTLLSPLTILGLILSKHKTNETLYLSNIILVEKNAKN